MEFRPFQRDSVYAKPYAQLLAQHRLWQKLSALIKKRLPANLAPHYRVACLEGDTLMIFAENSLVANRLKMLLPAMLDGWTDRPAEIRHIRVSVSPDNRPAERESSLQLDDNARDVLARTATRLQRHPELAAALHDLAHNKN